MRFCAARQMLKQDLDRLDLDGVPGFGRQPLGQERMRLDLDKFQTVVTGWDRRGRIPPTISATGLMARVSATSSV